MQSSSSAFDCKPLSGADRRAHGRPTMVLRVGLLEYGGKSSFCLLRNVSPEGVQVKLYMTMIEGTEVNLRVGDETVLPGRVVWVRNGLAGVMFKDSLDPNTLLRVRQMTAPQRRRASPRAQASGSAVLRTGGQEYSARLCDISTFGAKVVTARPIDAGPQAVLELPKLPALQGFVRWTHGQDTGLVFATPIPIQALSDWLLDHPDVTTS